VKLPFPQGETTAPKAGNRHGLQKEE